MNMYGGMFQAWILDNMILRELETERIVEKRIDIPQIDWDFRELLQKPKEARKLKSELLRNFKNLEIKKTKSIVEDLDV